MEVPALRSPKAPTLCSRKAPHCVLCAALGLFSGSPDTCTVLCLRVFVIPLGMCVRYFDVKNVTPRCQKPYHTNFLLPTQKQRGAWVVLCQQSAHVTTIIPWWYLLMFGITINKRASQLLQDHCIVVCCGRGAWWRCWDEYSHVGNTTILFGPVREAFGEAHMNWKVSNVFDNFCWL